MSNYKRVLCSVDLTDEATLVIAAAAEVAQAQGAELDIMTVIRPLTHAYAGFETAGVPQALANFEAEARESAQGALNRWVEELGVEAANLLIEIGRPADQVKAIAKERGADLIVMGSHGKHGLGLLLGSTANGVLHGAPCDVLTIRIED